MPIATAICDKCETQKTIKFSGSSVEAAQREICCGPMRVLWKPIAGRVDNGPYYLSSDINKPYSTKMAATESMKRAGFGAVGN
jgi:hypothetical protein